MASQTTVEVMKDHPAQVKEFGANGKAPQAAYQLNADVTDLATTVAQVNKIKALLIACGLAK